MSMEHLISRTRKAACTLAAAALALSCWPLSAFAADQISAEAPLAAGAGAAQTQATYTARDGQLSVTAPVSMTLAASDGTPLDVRHLENWPAFTQSLSFKNNSATKLYLSSATVSAASDAKAIFTGGKLDLTLTGEGTSTATAAIPVASTAATGFSMPSDMKTAFVLAGSASATFALAVSLPTAYLKDASTLAANGFLGGATSQLVSLSWTFTAIDPTDELLDKDGFYLKIANDATHAGLVPNKGKVYSLAEVTAMADDLASKGASSSYYPMFNAMVTDVEIGQPGNTASYAAGQYTCQVKWGGTAYDVRVIGINHDDLTTAVGGRTKAGLTFQFATLMNGRYQFNSNNTISGGWGASELRANMNPSSLPNVDGVVHGDDTDSIWKTIPEALQQAFKTVSKPFSSTYKGAGTQAYSNDKVFVPSYWELGGSFSSTLGWDRYTYLSTKEGTQYAYWKNKGARGYYLGNDHQVLLMMEQSQFASGSWFQRTLYPDSDQWTYRHRVYVNGSGNPVSGGMVDSFMDVCPCFCL